MADHPETDLKDSLGSRKDQILPRIVESLFGTEVATAPDKQFLLPDEFYRLIQPALKKIDFPVSDTPDELLDHTYASHLFYKIDLEDGYLALLFLRNNILVNGNASYNMFWMGNAWTNADHGGHAVGMFFFSDSTNVDPAFEGVKSYFEDGLKIKKVEFFDRSFAQRLIAFNEASVDKVATLLKDSWSLGGIFKARVAHPAVPELKLEKERDSDKIDRLVEILSKQASNAPVAQGVEGYLRNIIQQTKWPTKWKKARISGLTEDPDSSARELINYALGQGEIEGQGGLTALGSLLQELQEDLGKEDNDFVKDILLNYKL